MEILFYLDQWFLLVIDQGTIEIKVSKLIFLILGKLKNLKNFVRNHQDIDNFQ